MTQLIITDIRKSCYDRGYDLITAVFLKSGGQHPGNHIFPAEKGLLVLESATAERENPVIGVNPGDQYMRIRARLGHGLKVGEEIQLDGV